MPPRLKSPLRYPNDRRKAASIVDQFIPKDVNKIISPFFGGGGLEIALINRGYKIDGHVDFKNLHEFWRCLLDDPQQLYNFAHYFYPIEDKDIFYLLQEKINDHDDAFTRAALFYVINRCTEKGTVTSGKLMENHPEFNEYFLEKLRRFNIDGLNVFCSQAINVINNCNGFMLCCPPDYSIETLLGPAHHTQIEKPNINHTELNNILNEKNNWVLLVNYHENLIEMYDKHQKVYLDINYNISDVSPSHILITNGV